MIFAYLIAGALQDLLEAAEVISTLLSDTDKLGQAIKDIREASDLLVAPAKDDSTDTNSRSLVSSDSRKELYQYAQMVNFLLDSPEKVSPARFLINNKPCDLHIHCPL